MFKQLGFAIILKVSHPSFSVSIALAFLCFNCFSVIHIFSLMPRVHLKFPSANSATQNVEPAFLVLII